MPFMVPEIYKDKWMEIETSAGTEYLPLSEWADQEMQKALEKVQQEDEKEPDPRIVAAVKDCVEGQQIYKLHVIEGFGARLTAPGYMDRTEWTVFDTEQEAKEYIEQSFEVCSNCGHDLEEGEVDVCPHCKQRYATSTPNENLRPNMKGDFDAC